MELTSTSFDPETVKLMGRACDRAWQEIQSTYYIPSIEQETQLRWVLAQRVINAISHGERDEESLKRIALAAFEA